MDYPIKIKEGTIVPVEVAVYLYKVGAKYNVDLVERQKTSQWVTSSKEVADAINDVISRNWTGRIELDALQEAVNKAKLKMSEDGSEDYPEREV